MHALYNQGTDAFPFEIFETLLNAEFPFDGIGRIRKHLIDWNLEFQKMLEYKAKFDPDKDYIHVPQFKNPSNKYFKVGQWCAHQKQRRKGNKNYGMDWLPYEEEKMNSVNFVWDLSKMGKRIDKDRWMDNLAEVEDYYSNSNNYKTVPSQKTYIGHWLSDQMSFKTKQDRENRNDLISEEHELMLGQLLKQNGVEWEYRKQMEREGILSKLEDWRYVENLKVTGNLKEFRDKNPQILKKKRDNVAQLRSQSKRWNNDKNNWKYKYLDDAGFPYK
ncbi:hypothetical protein BTO06_12450 [Tenacibaculum sp. SZ-18]|uniref:hypothetical protein n=1 Tax=Tenacibaculum sp. SZ-18 TaxID=754423 RepID=UPI000C2D4075|nr:hypothetical protein [Tenacibaculum sp. SZ-18]AUC15912.1 hypothetical protein BTO06_12450 [Tenacibaculum sp. SZ-18]